MVFDYFFPQVFGFGVGSIPPGAVFNREGYAALIRDALRAEPEKAEQLVRVTGVPPESDTRESAIDVTTRLLRYTVFGMADLIQVAGGNPYGNIDRQDTGSDDDAALNRGVERIAADPDARAYLMRYYQPTGNLARPLVTLHTRRDPLVPFMHEILYRRAAAAADAGSAHTGLSVGRYGHCNFTAGEILGAVALLIERADVPVHIAWRAYRPGIGVF